jgi:hypothetical protein
MSGTPKKQAPKSGGALPPPLGRPLTTSTSSSSQYPDISGSWDSQFQQQTAQSVAADPVGVEVGVPFAFTLRSPSILTASVWHSG